jgi:hypothetical protein
MKMKMADGSQKEVLHNGFTRDEITAPGFAGARVEGPAIITRGILLDIAG